MINFKLNNVNEIHKQYAMSDAIIFINAAQNVIIQNVNAMV